MVACLVQQGEYQRILIDNWMEGKAAIKTDKSKAAQTKRLGVHDPCLRIHLIFDAGERGSEFGYQGFQDVAAALRAAKGDILWQGVSVQHARIAGFERTQNFRTVADSKQ